MNAKAQIDELMRRQAVAYRECLESCLRALGATLESVAAGGWELRILTSDQVGHTLDVYESDDFRGRITARLQWEADSGLLWRFEVQQPEGLEVNG